MLKAISILITIGTLSLSCMREDSICLLGVSLDIDHLEVITGWDKYSPFFKGKDSTVILSQNKTIENVKKILIIEHDGTGGVFLK